MNFIELVEEFNCSSSFRMEFLGAPQARVLNMRCSTQIELQSGEPSVRVLMKTPSPARCALMLHSTHSRHHYRGEML
jgi:hypothetical protein